MSTNKQFRSNIFTRQTVNVQEERMAQHNAEVATLTALMAKLHVERAEFVKTLVKDVRLPLVEKATGKAYTFGELFTLDQDKYGRPMVVVFPWNEKTVVSKNGLGAISALMAGFGTASYSWILQEGEHSRIFDPQKPLDEHVRNVRLIGADGRFGWYVKDWKNDTWNSGRISSRDLDNFVGLHQELDEMLRALNRGYRVVFSLFDDYQVGEFARKITGRLNMTVAEALEAKGEDWNQAKANKVFATPARNPETASENGVSLDGAVIVGKLDLRSVPLGEVVKIMWEGPANAGHPLSFTFHGGDPDDLRNIAEKVAKTNGDGQPLYKMSVKEN